MRAPFKIAFIAAQYGAIVESVGLTDIQLYGLVEIGQRAFGIACFVTRLSLFKQDVGVVRRELVRMAVILQRTRPIALRGCASARLSRAPR